MSWEIVNLVFFQQSSFFFIDRRRNMHVRGKSESKYNLLKRDVELESLFFIKRREILYYRNVGRFLVNFLMRCESRDEHKKIKFLHQSN